MNLWHALGIIALTAVLAIVAGTLLGWALNAIPDAWNRRRGRL